MADTVTAPTSTPAQTVAPAPIQAPATKEKPETTGTIATGAPIKGTPAPEQGKKLYIVA